MPICFVCFDVFEVSISLTKFAEQQIISLDFAYGWN